VTSSSLSPESASTPAARQGGARRAGPSLLFALALVLGCAGTPARPDVAGLAPAPGPVEVLLEEGRYVYDLEGRKTYHYTLRYRVIGPVPADSRWAVVQVGWAPWHEATPSVDAVVRRPGVPDARLDPSGIETLSTRGGPADRGGARRVLRAPLGPLPPGTEVEQRIELRETAPAFAAGTVERFFFGLAVPARTIRMVVEAPSKLPLRWRARGLELRPEVSEAEGRQRLVFELSDVPARGPAAVLPPPGRIRHGHVELSTGESWNAVARGYFEQVEVALASGGLAELAESAAAEVTEPAEQLARVVSVVRGLVRPTRTELGHAPLAPAPPRYSLGTGWGDSKDAAALVVGLMRALGVEAHVALLRAGVDEDADPELPGIGAFNHALVLLPGERPLWLDPSAPFTPVGELPLPAQGRLALVVRPDTQVLVRTPQATSKDNGYVERREIALAAFGPAAVSESLVATGAIASALRAQFHRTAPDQLQETFERYARAEYTAPRLDHFEFGDPQDLSRPWHMKLRAAEAGVGFTASDDAIVQVRPQVLFTWIPDELRDLVLDRSRRVEAPLGIPQPYRAELELRAIAPDGYVPRRLPPGARHRLGPGTFTSTFTVDGGAIVARYVLDTGAARSLSVSEAQALVDGLRAALEEPVVQLEFDHAGARAIDAGRVGEGLAVYRDLVRRHPDSAVHRAQLAEALVDAGLGLPARDVAAEAVALDPGSELARLAEGWVLQHDLLGRPFAEGFERARAIKAYREVLARRPDHRDARFNLALLLERGPDGVRYGLGADLDEALALFLSLRAEGPRDGIDEHVVRALWWLGKVEALRELAPELDRSATRDAHWIGAEMMVEGVEAGLRLIGTLAVPEKARAPLLDVVVATLTERGAYREARDLLDRLPVEPGSPASERRTARLDALRRLRPADAVMAPATTPFGVLQRFLAELHADSSTVAATAERWLATTPDPADRAAHWARYQQLREVARAAIRRLGPPSPLIRDSLIALTELELDGDAALGYRIRTRPNGPGAMPEGAWFLVTEAGRPRLRASDRAPWALGEEALARLARGDQAGARRWLDWAVALGDDGDGGGALQRLWPPARGGDAARSPARARFAAAAIAALGPRPEPALRAMRAAAEAPEIRGLADVVELTTAEVLTRVGQARTTLTIANKMLIEDRSAPEAQALKFRVLRALERPGQARAFALARLARDPDDSSLYSALGEAEAMRGDYGAARDALRRLVVRRAASPTDLNNFAWYGLFVGTELGEDVVEAALEANRRTEFRSPVVVHTLAAVFAEMGRGKEALELLRRAIDLRPDARLEPHDRYVVGRVLEAWSFSEAAIRIYERIERPSGPTAADTWELARARLEALRRAR
jgi:tetratricopeptide (TPR) repeat protein